ncbi:helix-turn-helix transcriptional regulator [Clostridium baratii]
MEFYKVLENLMKNRNLSIPDISRATGLSDSTLRSILSRKTKNISLEVAFKLSQGLNVSLEELNGDTNITTAKISLDYSDEEKNHIEDLRKLNDMGKEKVITYTKDLLDNPKFNNNNISCTIRDIDPVVEDDGYVPRVFAAHSDGIDEKTNRRNIEMIKRLELEKRRKKNNK